MDILKAQVAEAESEDNDDHRSALSGPLSRLDSAKKVSNKKGDEQENEQKKPKESQVLTQRELAAIEPAKSVNEPSRSNSIMGHTKPVKNTGDDRDDVKPVSNSSNDY